MNDNSETQKLVLADTSPIARWEWAAIAGIAAMWFLLGLTILFVGPSERDDVLYTDLASSGKYLWEVQHRYVHIWMIRLFVLAFGSLSVGAGIYSVTVVVATAVVSYFVARRLGGASCAVASLALIPAYPAYLQFISVPYVDPAMTLWSLTSIWGVLVCMAPSRKWHLWVGALVSGFGFLLAIKSKETGIAVFPALALGLWYSPRRLQAIFGWLAGVFAGWLTLLGLDCTFSNSETWSATKFPLTRSHPLSGSKGGASRSSNIKPNFKMALDFVHLSLANGFLPWTLAGTAGVVSAVKQKLEGRVLVVWLLGSMLFQTLIGGHYQGIEASTRYAVVVGPPLVILGVFWVRFFLVRRVESEPVRYTLAVAAAVLFTAAFPLALNGAKMFGELSPHMESMLFFFLPLGIVVAFVSTFLSNRRWMQILAISLFLTLALSNSWNTARSYINESRERIASWSDLAGRLEENGADLVRWKTKSYPYSIHTIRRRLQTVSADPGSAPSVRKLIKLEDRKPNEWVFTSGHKNSVLTRAGYKKEVTGGFRKKSGGHWSAWSPP